ncbi:MAG: hypothetical protein V1487_04565 [bacterium]
MNLELLKNKHVQLVLGISLGILVLIAILSPKRSVTPTTPPLPSPFRPELQQVSDARRRKSITYRESIKSKLPIYRENIETSVGIETTLNLYFLDSDPAETLRFEIYGLSYLNRGSSEFTNPNITAFKETFQKGLALLTEKNIDPAKLIFIYGDKEYVRTTAQAWVDKYHLLP